MKQTVLTLALALCSIGVYGQHTQYEVKMKRYSQKVDSIVHSEKQQMNRELTALEELYKKENRSAEELVQAKSQVAQKYEAKINTQIAAEKQALEELTKERVRLSVFGIRATGVVEHYTTSTPKKMNTPRKYKPTRDFTISYGFLNLASANDFHPFNANSAMRFGNTHSVELQLRKEVQLGEKNSPLSLKYCIGYRSDTYMPKRPNIFTEDNEQLNLQAFDKGRLKRSKLRNIYAVVPLEFQYILNPKYKTYDGTEYIDYRKKQWRIGLGLYGGLKLRTITKVKYYNADDQFKKYQDRIDSGVNPYIFGAKLSMSYGGLSVFVKKDFTPIFNDDAHLPFKHGIQVGVDLMNINF